MKNFPLRYLDLLFRQMIPVLMAFFFILIGFIPIYLPFYDMISPHFVIMCIYYWALVRPDLMRCGRCVFLGLLYDLLLGCPLGVHALIFGLIYWICRLYERLFIGENFNGIWIGFGFVVIFSLFLSWILSSILLSFLLPFNFFLFSYFCTFLLFPFFSFMMTKINVSFLKAGAL